MKSQCPLLAAACRPLVLRQSFELRSALTCRSSGRAKACFARFSPPLTSTLGPMNPLRRVLAIAVGILVWPLRAFSQSPRKTDDDAGRQFRQMVLGTRARELGLSSSPEFPRVFGVVMDWPLGDVTATIVSLADGTASLYTTSTFGIIGGQAHEPVRQAGKRFIAAAERHYPDSQLTTDFPYPTENRIAFYFLCYDGVRRVEAPLAPVQAGTSAYSALFAAGQEVLTALRKTVRL